MTSSVALSAAAAGGPLKPTVIARRDLRPDDVLIEILFTGICHSDVHQVDADWGTESFPMVPGHEIAGVVAACGSDVTRFSVGSRVGVGVFVDSCGECKHCRSGEEHFCSKWSVPQLS